MLNGVRKTFGSTLSFGKTITAGVVGGVVYLVANGSEYLKNLRGSININLSGLNYTEIQQQVFSHGNVSIPYDVKFDSQAFKDCATPVLIGAGIGASLSMAYIALDTAYRCHKAKAKNQNYVALEEATSERDPEQNSNRVTLDV